MISVTFRYKPVEWNSTLNKLFYESVCQQVSGDDWDSTTDDERNQMRGMWYHGYIIGGASAGSY